MIWGCVAVKRRANGILLWIVLLMFVILGVWLIVSNIIQPSRTFILAFVVFTAYVIINLFLRISHVVTLCSDGVKLFCFRKLVRYLPWEDVCQICTMSLLPISMKVSSPTLILIVPKGCVQYKRNMFGCAYLFANRQHVFSVDDAPTNRKIINEYYGEIDKQD